MKVKMITSIAGRDFSFSPGDVTDRFSDAEALRFIAAGYCEEVKAEKKNVKRGGKTVETAAIEQDVEERG